VGELICAHCNKAIEGHGRYYQGVPGIGDLCLLCHKEWREQDGSVSGSQGVQCDKTLRKNVVGGEGDGVAGGDEG